MLKLRQWIPKDYCLGCQGCCRFAQEDSIWSPRLLAEEKKQLNIRLLANPEENNFLCAFLNTQSNKCKIYQLRPFECQLYPFLFNCQDKKNFLAVDLNCPFVKENKDSPEFKEYGQWLTELFKTPSFLNILKNNPQAIQTYTGALNLAELDI
jgi:Fe-S-cluster containining protein